MAASAFDNCENLSPEYSWVTLITFLKLQGVKPMETGFKLKNLICTTL